MALIQPTWYLSDGNQVFGPFNPIGFHSFLLQRRDHKDLKMSLFSETKDWVPLREMEALIETLNWSIRKRDGMRLQTVVQIMNCYLANKKTLRLGQLRLAKQAVINELPLSWLSFGGDWYREVEEELNDYLRDQYQWRIYSRNYRAARIPILHLFQAYKLIQLLRQAEKALTGTAMSSFFAVVLALLPGVFIYHMQNRLNEFWTIHLRRHTRRSERFTVDLGTKLFRYPGGGSRYTVLSEGRCFCLGFGGALLELDGPQQIVKVGDELLLAFPSVEDTSLAKEFRVKNFLINGQVAWTSAQGLGIRFMGLNREQEYFLANVLQLNF